MVEVDDHWAKFRFLRPAATEVHLAGEFNDWRAGELPMQRDEQGCWTATLYLPMGDYRFRYCADGEWFCDFAAFGVTYGPFGPDSVVHVAPKQELVADQLDAVCEILSINRTYESSQAARHLGETYGVSMNANRDLETR